MRNLDGPLGFSFGNYKVINQSRRPRSRPSSRRRRPRSRTTACEPAAADQLRFASFNVENFFPAGGDVDRHIVTQEEYEAKRDDIAAAIATGSAGPT